jgi:hypothetical protein
MTDRPEDRADSDEKKRAAARKAKAKRKPLDIYKGPSGNPSEGGRGNLPPDLLGRNWISWSRSGEQQDRDPQRA